MKSATAIAFDYHASRTLVVAICTVALLAIVALALSGMPLWLKIAVGVFACAYLAHALHRFLHTPVRRAAWHAAGHWRIADAGGTEHVAELEHAVVRSTWIVLRLRRSDRMPIALVLGPDNSDADLRRRLRVRLARVSDAIDVAIEPPRSGEG
jgi:toxin CptA